MSAFKKRGHDPVANSKLILLAEDHPLNQKVAMLLLDRMGYDTHVVSNGEEAVQAVKRTIYDAILMDCHMPEMDGFEATRRIRQYESDKDIHVPIIAVTALAMAGDRERCLSAGMDDYLTKPIDRDLLHDKLVYWMNPGTITAIKNPAKVIHLFEGAFSLQDANKDEPIKLGQFWDSYGDEAPELLRLFINSSQRLIDQLQQAFETENAPMTGSIAHEMKGASWAVGADEMARLSVFLEQAAGQGNWRLVHRTFVRLSHHFEEVKAFVNDKLRTQSSSSSAQL